MNSNPSITDPNSTLRGPGYVAPVSVGGHFPPNIANTPQVDLFQIEGTNRDTAFSPGTPYALQGRAVAVFKAVTPLRERRRISDRVNDEAPVEASQEQ